MIEYNVDCCRKSAASDTDFRFKICPICQTNFYRCPRCRDLITPLGGCETCLHPVVKAPKGIVQPEGSALDMPFTVHNEGSAPFRLRALVCRSGGRDVRVDLGGVVLERGVPRTLSVPVVFPCAGHFSLDLQLELGWKYAERLGFHGVVPDAVEITARLQGPLISAHSEGTGNLVNVSGSADQLLSQALRTRGPSVLPPERCELSPMSAVRLEDFGDKDGIVSYATELEVPDMLGPGPSARLLLKPRFFEGLCLGRDRPRLAEGQAAGSSPGAACTDAALRFPSGVPESRDLTMSISRRHWRLYPQEGRWHIEQLGQQPTVLMDESGRKTLERGDREPLRKGTKIYALAAARRRLGFELVHTAVEGGHVKRSALRSL